MFGKLTLDAIPFNDPIIMTAVSGVIVAVVAVAALITYFKKWGYLWQEWFTSLDHKRIGVMYIFMAIIMLIRGFADAIFMRAHLALASTGTGEGFLPPHHYDQFFTAHGVIMIFFVAMPFLIGLMNLIVPLQIGARDIAFPFLNSLSFWLFVAGVLLINVSLGVGEFARTGWLAYTPLSGKYDPGVGVDYWAWGLQVSGIGTLLSGVNFVVTILKKRAPTMPLMKMPVFTWTALCSNILIIAIFPILTAAILFLTLDRYLDFHFFTNDLGGNQMMYVNLIWIWGHPEVYVLALPAFGIFSEVVATFSRKPLFGYRSMVIATASITILSFLVWLHHFFTMGAGANVNAFFGIMTMIIAVPTGLKVFNWLFTMYKGRVQFTAAMWWTMAFLCIFVLGGMTGVLLAIPAANFAVHNSMFVVAHFHNTIIGSVVTGVFAGIMYWFPRAFGFKLNETLGKASCACWVIGFFLAFMPLYLLGLDGMPRRISYHINPEWHPLLLVALSGAVTVLVGIGLFVLQIFYSILHRKENMVPSGDPWDGRTLEWAVPVSLPAYNFAVEPDGSKLDAFWEMKKAGTAYQEPEHYEDIAVPKSSATGVLIGLFAFIFGFAMVWQIWWLAIAGFAGIVAVWVYRTSNDSPDYIVSAQQARATFREHLAKVKEAQTSTAGTIQGGQI